MVIKVEVLLPTPVIYYFTDWDLVERSWRLTYHAVNGKVIFVPQPGGAKTVFFVYEDGTPTERIGRTWDLEKNGLIRTVVEHF